MKYRSHRGGVFYTPENTMPAFYDALEKGFEYIETDPNCTKDGKVILMHDYTINRTCRNPDGSEIKEAISVSDHTFDELLQYDAGLCAGKQFKGTKIPLLEELLAAAEDKNVVISLDKKIETDKLDILFDVVAKYKTKVSFSVADIKRIEKILRRFPDALIDYDGPATDEMLGQVTAMVKPENLIVWLYMDKPNFDWLEPIRKVSSENCARVKRYATLGIGNINNAYDVFEALAFAPDIIEV